MRKQDVTCPRCGSRQVYYLDISICIDFDYLAYENGRVVWTQNSYNRDHLDVPVDVELDDKDGTIACQRESCRAEWPDLAAFQAELDLKPAEDERWWADYTYDHG
jgi:hypothetical protein